MILFLFYMILGLIILISVVLLVRPLRYIFVSSPLLKIYRKILPQISQTEQEALDAGTVWWDG